MPVVDPRRARTSNTALRLQGFGPLGVLAIAVILAGSLAGPIVSGALVLVWARLADLPLRSLGLTPPRSWLGTLVGGTAFGIAFKFGMKAIVMPLLGAPAVNASYHYLAGNAEALPGMIATILVSAGIGEELFFRGYLFERLGRLFGHGSAAVGGTIVLSSLLFAMAHYGNQGLPGVEQAAITGLVIGGIYARLNELWTAMVIHAAFDLTAVALIYWNLENGVAHVLWR